MWLRFKASAISPSSKNAGASGRADLDRAERIGCRRERLVEADERFAALRLAYMKCIREINPAPRPIQRLGGERRILQADARQPRERLQRPHKPGRGVAVDAAQHPLAFQQYARADEHLLAVDQRLCL